MSTQRKLILYIAMSIDGYIAKPNGDLGFLSMVEQKGQDYGYSAFYKTIDTIILGRKTYDKVLTMVSEFPHQNKDVYVITRSERPDIGRIKFYSRNINELITSLKNHAGKNIYCDGGAEIVHESLKENLIDELIISVIPVLLGEGISLFKQGRPEIKLKLLNSNQFEKGLVQLHYVRDIEK